MSWNDLAKFIQSMSERQRIEGANVTLPNHQNFLIENVRPHGHFTGKDFKSGTLWTMNAIPDPSLPAHCYS